MAVFFASFSVAPLREIGLRPARFPYESPLAIPLPEERDMPLSM
jgi:hypothetical protein